MLTTIRVMKGWLLLATLLGCSAPAPLVHEAEHELPDEPLVIFRARVVEVPPEREIVKTASLLKSGLSSPMPGGYMSGYQADTGLDIAGFLMPVYAIAAGTIEYSEPGHTRWTGPGDDDKAVRLRLDEPIPYQGRLITHAWYAHLRELAFEVAEDDEEKVHVVAGERLGTSGMANGAPHLHIGLLLDGHVSQRWGNYLLEDEVRVVFGGYRARERLPSEPRPR